MNTIQSSETDLSVLHNGGLSHETERLDHPINGTGKLSLTTAKAGFLPHTLIIKKIPDGLKMFIKKTLKSGKKGGLCTTVTDGHFLDISQWIEFINEDSQL